MAQADKMRAKATKTDRRAEHGPAGREAALRPGGRPRLGDKVAKVRFPNPGAVRQDPADRDRAVQVVRVAGDLHRRRRGRRPGLPGGDPRPQRRRQDHAAADARPACSSRTPARSPRATACGWATTRRSTRRSTSTAPILEHMRSAAPEQTDTELRRILGAFLFTGDDVDKPAGVLSGGEKTRLALATLVCSGANVLLLDEPTNNLDPISREQVLDAIARYPGAIVLVTHDPGAVTGAQARPGDPAARRRRGRLERRPPGARRARLTPRSGPSSTARRVTRESPAPPRRRSRRPRRRPTSSSGVGHRRAGLALRRHRGHRQPREERQPGVLDAAAGQPGQRSRTATAAPAPTRNGQPGVLRTLRRLRDQRRPGGQQQHHQADPAPPQRRPVRLDPAVVVRCAAPEPVTQVKPSELRGDQHRHQRAEPGDQVEERPPAGEVEARPTSQAQPGRRVREQRRHAGSRPAAHGPAGGAPAVRPSALARTPSADHRRAEHARPRRPR